MSEQERREELVAAAATGDLTPAEERELEAMCAADPSVRAEVEELSGVVGRIDRVEKWTEPTAETPRRVHDARRVPAGPVALAAAAALVLGVGLGVAGTLGLQGGSGSGDADTVTGPAPTGAPGELGAVEPVDLAEPDGSVATLDAALVAHTWGTEAVLDVEGLPVGSTYEVVLVDARGAAVSAGAFLGSEVPIHCSLNAAVLREDVRALRIVGPADEVVGEASVPSVAG